MKEYLKSLYRKQGFLPGWIGIFVNPFYFARSGLHDVMEYFAPCLNGNLLDIGCGTKPCRSLFEVESYVGLDIERDVPRPGSAADFLYDGQTFPFEDCSFNSALSNQVLEHVFNPDEFLSEINRVLKKGGKLLLTVPFVWDEHEQPYDYARYSTFGLTALLENNGFTLVEHRKLGANTSVLFQLTNAYLYKVTQRWPKLLKFLFTATVMAGVTIIGIVSAKILPENPDLFLDHVVLAEKS